MSTPNKLTGKTAIVTGASKGIGAAIAKQLAAEGAEVVVNYSSDQAGADKTVADITAAGGKAIAVKASVAEQADIDHLIAEGVKAYGKIDILVNNAGVYQFAPLEEITAAEFHRQYNTNVLGLLLTTQAAVRHFPAEGGAVINISSVAATFGMPGGAIYCGTKAAEGTAAAGIDGSDFQKTMIEMTPLGRIGVPQDIATAAVFLASSDSSWIAGESFFISGGYR